MEVMKPLPPVDFHFDSNSTSPFLTPPSSPPGSHFSPFFSAPTSPSSSFRRFDAFSTAAASSIPFSWEEKPGTPKAKHRTTESFFDKSDVWTSLHAIPFSWEEKPGTPKTKHRTTESFFDKSDVWTSLHGIPFSWEEKPGTPKTRQNPTESSFENLGQLGVWTNTSCAVENEADFEFDFSGQIDRTSLCLSAADELFDGGVIKPLKPPPRLQFSDNNNAIVESPKSPIKSNFFKEALSPRHHKKKDFDPFEAAIEQTRRESYNGRQKNDKLDNITDRGARKLARENLYDNRGERESEERGRERAYDSSGKGSRRAKGTRSLSPFRVSDIFAENYQESSSPKNNVNNVSCSGWRGFLNKRWKLRDLLLFRSASEGRATTAAKDPLNKYSLLKQGGGAAAEDGKNSSFRSTESAGSVSRRRASAGGPVSAHELHYTTNRAVSEEMRRKTFLPYNHGLLGCLGFNPAVHDISRGIGSVTRGRS